MTLNKDDIIRAIATLDDEGFARFLDFMEGKWDTPWQHFPPSLETEQQVEARTISYGDIGWAVNHVRLGHKMRRTSWPAGVYVALDGAVITLFTPPFGGVPTPGQMWRNTNADLLTNDWAMAEPTLPGEYHS